MCLFMHLVWILIYVYLYQNYLIKSNFKKTKDNLMFTIMERWEKYASIHNSLFVSSIDKILILNFSLENDKFKMIVKESHFSSYNAKYYLLFSITF